MAVDKFNDFLRFNLLNKLNSTKSGLYLMAKDWCGSKLFRYYRWPLRHLYIASWLWVNL